MKFDKSKYKAVMGSGVTSTSTNEDGRSEFPLIATDDIAYDDNTRLDEALAKFQSVDVDALKQDLLGEKGTIDRLIKDYNGIINVTFHVKRNDEDEIKNGKHPYVKSVNVTRPESCQISFPELDSSKVSLARLYDNFIFYVCVKVYDDDAHPDFTYSFKQLASVNYSRNSRRIQLCMEFSFDAKLYYLESELQLSTAKADSTKLECFKFSITEAPYITTAGGQRIAGSLTMNSAKVETKLEGNEITAATSVTSAYLKSNGGLDVAQTAKATSFYEN